MLTRYGTKKIIMIALCATAFFIVFGYGIFATHDYIVGHSFSITEPVNGSSSLVPNVRIRGVVERAQEISLNSRSITIDDKGNFNEAVLLAPGYNIFTFVVRDKFGRSKEYRLEYVYKVN